MPDVLTQPNAEEATQPLEYDRDEKREIIDALNEALSREFQAVIMYTQYAASVTGPFRQQLSQFFSQEIPDELGHAQYLANKVAALGGVPTVTPAPVPQTTDAKEMLQNVVQAEDLARHKYAEYSELADKHGDVGLRNHLEDFADDETHHMEETEKQLRGWN
jgi:bacterioferritin